jgi:diguanylate cyclase (GGDEF)-like protein/PAS domain S-box-containing protein
MTLRTKTLLIIGMTLIALIVVLYATLSSILYDRFAKVEQLDAEENVRRVRDAYDHELDKLDQQASDWAEWDATYAFIKDRNKQYINETLIDEAIARVNLNLILYINTAGEVVWGTGFDLEHKRSTPVPDSIWSLLKTKPTLLQLSSHNSNTAGLVLLPEGPMMVAGRPILPSDGQGLARGMLIMGRYLDETAIQQLEDRTSTSLTVYQYDYAQLPPDFQKARLFFSKGESPPIEALDENKDRVAAYTLLKDVFGTPSLLVRLDNARPIYNEGQTSIQYLLMALVAAGLVFGGTALILLEKVILSRLARLNAGVSRIGANRDLSMRLPVSGRDELSSLTGAINETLEALERSQNERQESEARYRVVVEQASEGIFLVDLDTKGVLEANAAFQKLLGYTAPEVTDLTLYEIANNREQVDHDVEQVLKEKQYFIGERQYRRQNGTFVDLEVSSNLISRGGRDVLCFLVHDLTERKRAEAERVLRQSEEHCRSLIGNTSDVIVVLEADGTMRYQSPATERAWGYEPAALNGRNAFELVHPDDLFKAHELLVQTLDRLNSNITTEIRIQHANGSWRHFEVITNNLLIDKTVAGIVATYHDITQRKAFEEELLQLAFHDSLTKLPNRALFMDRLEHALACADRRNASVAVMFLDLDNFKVVNDSLGHQIGDELLIAVATRLATCLRSQDTAARIGGDEFTILLEDVASMSDVLLVADRITEQFQQPFMLEGHEIYTSTSIGIALSTPGKDQPGGLLRDADIAMYRAKSRGKAHYEVFDHTMNSRAMERLELETDLRRAIERNEFRVYYQPIVQLDTNKIVEVEALVRWEHPRRGLVAPAQFIPLAEETGLILPIGKWVLEEACRQVQQWQTEYPETEPLVVSVNLSARQFQHPRLAAEIAETLFHTGLDPAHLKLEITESVMMQDAKATIGTLWELKELGIQLAVDDFGTGYSSLAYLKRFPIDILKIDRSFVDRLGRDPEDTAIVRAVITLAKTLNLAVTGEGIETIEQVLQLQALGCERGQGYYFAKPLTDQALRERLLMHIPQEIQNIDRLASVSGLTESLPAEV